MKQLTSVTGRDLKEMFSTATVWLEKNASAVDAINVFPVPDGDCGRNMLLTMRSAMEAAYQAPNQSATYCISISGQPHRVMPPPTRSVVACL